mgnify:CR=1 FL=1
MLSFLSSSFAEHEATDIVVAKKRVLEVTKVLKRFLLVGHVRRLDLIPDPLALGVFRPLIAFAIMSDLVSKLPIYYKMSAILASLLFQDALTSWEFAVRRIMLTLNANNSNHPLKNKSNWPCHV